MARRPGAAAVLWLALLAGILCEMVACGTFVSGALSTP